MNLIRPRVSLVVALSVMVFTSTVVVLAGIHDAPSAFAGGDTGYVISTPDAPTVFSSTVDIGLQKYLPNASPEVFAFSSYSGVPFVIRGIDWGFVDLGEHRYFRQQNATPLADTQAIVGSRLEERLGLVPPCDLPVAGSYSSSFAVLSVIGSFESDSPIDDEVLVSLDTARSLCGMSGDKVSIFRLSTISSDVEQALDPQGAQFAIYDYSASKSRVVSGEVFDLSVSLKNWGTESGKVSVGFLNSSSADSSPGLLWSENLTLPAGSVVRITHSFSFDTPGEQDLQVAMNYGKKNQSLSLSVDVVTAYIVLRGPGTVSLNSSFGMQVMDHASWPIEGAKVQFLNQTAYTNSSGIATLCATELGERALSVSYPGLSNGTTTISVYDDSAYPNEFKPTIVFITVAPNQFRETESAEVTVVVRNEGRQGGIFTKEMWLDHSTSLAEISLPLGPGESKIATYPLGSVRAGSHTVSVGTLSASFQVSPWYSGDPDLVMLAIKYGGTLQISSSEAIPIVQAAKLSEGAIQVALASIGGISGTLAALSMVSIFSKEIHEERDKLGILRTIGASRSRIRRMVVGQSLAASLPAALGGIGVGVAVSGVLLRSGALMMFGHSLTFDVDLTVIPAILFGTLAICVASALASAEIAVRATPISSIRKTEEEPPEGGSVDEVLGDE